MLYVCFRPRWSAQKTNQLLSKMCTAVFELMLSSWASFLSWCRSCVLMNRTFHIVQLWHRWAGSIFQSRLLDNLYIYKQQVYVNTVFFINFVFRFWLKTVILMQTLNWTHFKLHRFCWSGRFLKMLICSRKMVNHVTSQWHPFDLSHRSVHSCYRSVFDSMYHLYQNLTNIAWYKPSI